ncbi:hypothetical protein L2755_08990 [Shewanella abyssi]|uniref:hypothetical protein n=1 Tax=Shewanella abyssi TaxID=311789 RepID=UPI00200D9EDC|nr:hypothetical protein [Shewanella abyssi]MCL1049754.1 hypothetical protein [Shewanella abyssi]
MATVLIAIVLLQFAGGNLGAHQLHLGDHEQEGESHPHIQFNADVTTLAQCIGDCTCPLELEAANESGSVVHEHTISKTESKSFDLCLDCPCHGGHVTAMSIQSIVPAIPVGDMLKSNDKQYLPPVQLQDYRPPIV